MKVLYQCSYCNARYNTPEEAIRCEQGHIAQLLTTLDTGLKSLFVASKSTEMPILLTIRDDKEKLTDRDIEFGIGDISIAKSTYGLGTPQQREIVRISVFRKEKGN